MTEYTESPALAEWTEPTKVQTPYVFNPDESNLVQHARSELKAAFGDFDEKSDDPADMWDKAVVKAVEELVTLFASQGHSGFSGGITLELFERLADFQNLSPLTDNPDEWQQHAEDMWQSRRNSKAFSTDGGKTYYTLGEAEDPYGNRVFYHSEPHKVG